MAEKDASRTSRTLERAMEQVPVEKEAFLGVVLNHALEAEANFIGLYDVVIGKVKDAEAKKKLKEFRGDHEDHLREIRGVLDQMNAPIHAEERPTPMAKGLVAELERADGDDALLMGFLATEDFSRHLYRWVSMIEAPEPVQRIAQRALADEERHYKWTASRCGVDATPI